MNRKQNALTLVEVLVIVAIIGMLIALLLPAVRTSREPARRNSCMNNLKQISFAILNYEALSGRGNGALPPAYTVDAEGNTLHSWRTLILPEMELAPLFEKVDLSVAWDAPPNEMARKAELEFYLCPSDPRPVGTTTTYLGIFGPNCVFTGPDPRELPESATERKMTMFLIDVPSSDAVPWMAPKDASEELVLSYGPETRTNHPGIFLAAFLDGHVTTLHLDTDREVLREMLTLDASEDSAEEATVVPAPEEGPAN